MKFSLLLKDIKTCEIHNLYLFLHHESHSFVRDEDKKMKYCNAEFSKYLNHSGKTEI